MFQIMYNMHWTLEDVQKLSVPQYNWIVEALKKQKKKERRAMRRRR